MFAPGCEVVLHDLTQPDRAIVPIANNLSNRRIGDAATEMGLERIASPEFPDVVQNYASVFPDGRPAKSTSIGLRNSQGRFVAAICLNLDVSIFNSVTAILQQLTAVVQSAAPQAAECTLAVGHRRGDQRVRRVACHPAARFVFRTAVSGGATAEAARVFATARRGRHGGRSARHLAGVGL